MQGDKPAAGGRHLTTLNDSCRSWSLNQRCFLCPGNVRSARKPPSGIAPSPLPPPTCGCMQRPRQLPGVTPLRPVSGSGFLRPRRDPRPRRRRLYRSLDGRLGCPNSRHDVPQYFCIKNAPISASISREVIDTRSITPVNSGRRTMMALGVQGSPSQEASGISTDSRRHLNAPVPICAITTIGRPKKTPWALNGGYHAKAETHSSGPHSGQSP